MALATIISLKARWMLPATFCHLTTCVRRSPVLSCCSRLSTMELLSVLLPAAPPPLLPTEYEVEPGVVSSKGRNSEIQVSMKVPSASLRTT